MSPSLTGLPESNAMRSTMPGRSALTVTPWTAATVPMALSVAGQLLLRRHDGGHGFGRRLHRGELRRHRLELPEFHEPERPR